MAGLLSTFVIFFVGFLARPIGALVFGSLADRVGRKPVMLVSMSLMAGGALIIGFAPGHATAGSLGTVLVVLGRLIQGLSAGGEQGAAGIFLVEWVGPRQRGFYGLIPVGGWVSDRVGRRPMFLFTAIGYLVLTVPLFALIVETKAFWSVLLLEFVLAFFSAAIGGTAVATIVELFTGRRRGLTVTMTLALGVTIFGGLATYACTWLISVTGRPLSVVYWVLGLTVITFVAAIFILRDLHLRKLA